MGKDPACDPASIGNLAIRKRYATQEQVTDALKMQEAQAPLGDALVKQGVVTAEQVEEIQKSQVPLGAILVAQGVLTKGQLEELLHLQEVERERSESKKTKLHLRRQKAKIREVAESLEETACECRVFAANGKV